MRQPGWQLDLGPISHSLWWLTANSVVPAAQQLSGGAAMATPHARRTLAH
jgi:hypothetical protein